MLPIALLRMRMSPSLLLGISPYKTLYGRPFLSADLLLDEELNQNVKCVTSLANFQPAIQKRGLESVPPTTTTPLYQEPKF